MNNKCLKRWAILWVALSSLLVTQTVSADETTVSFGIIGMGGGAVEAMKACQDELNVNITHLKTGRFSQEKLPDLAEHDALITSFTASHLKDQYRQAITEALAKKPEMKVFCVGPPAICGQWAEWIGAENLQKDPQLAAYYGLSNESMKEMVRYALIKYFGRKGEIVPPETENLVRIWHPELGEFETVEAFLEQAEKAGWNVVETPRVALGTWRHHLLFHQPKVVESLILELEKADILSVSFVADDPEFKDRLEAFKPDLVIMNSHTREVPAFWEKLNVPRLHALWFTEESIDKWRKSNQTGMAKSQIFHQIVSTELKGATETLAAGGTESGQNSGEEILPIPDRIRRIVGRVNGWINLSRKLNEDKKIAMFIYDHNVDKAGLMSGPANNLNAPESMVKFLNAMKEADYTLRDIPENAEQLIEQVVDHGRQMGQWEPGQIDRVARSGHAVLVPEDQYRNWFEEYVPNWRREQVLEKWGAVPGDIMVWEDKGKKYLVLPKIDLGNVILLTQPLKGETLTASMKVEDTQESLLPPTHQYLATYFWLQHEFNADAVVHFGTHGSEWLYEGKMAVMSRSDWSDIFLGNMPNINPWLTSNNSELLPNKRRAHAVHVGFIPPPLMDAGLPDELINLETDIHRYQQLDIGYLKTKFAKEVTAQTIATGMDRDMEIELKPDEVMTEEQITDLSLHLHDLMNAQVPSGMHILGEMPEDDLLFPYLIHSVGARYLNASKVLFDIDKAEDERGYLKKKGAQVLRHIIQGLLPFEEAVTAAGGKVPEGGLPKKITESFEVAVEMYKGLQQSHQEIDQILAALDGHFIAPGPSGSPERNPAVVPAGRNLFVLNPEELPSKASWDLACKLIDQHLEAELTSKGRYPRKLAFSLVPFATYNDFGIIESQIFYLMGVRPVWDAKNRVRDVELIPASELGRPRIDVFLSARSVYRDELPKMMHLIDKAIQLVASVNEADNYVYENSEATRQRLEADGVAKQRAIALSHARMFGAKPEEIIDSHNWFFYLTDRSGEWETREDLLQVYLTYNKHVYAEGVWGEHAPEAFDNAIQGTETIMRSWYDNRDFVLMNKFAWWVDGSLSMAIKHITGKEPDILFVDVRDPDAASLVDSNQVLQQDMRVRVNNPKWIKSMMEEGYAGANIFTRNIDNMMGWKIMRENSITDDDWNRVNQVYMRDKYELGLRKWFDETNPFAFQKMTVTMLETIRKGYWNADETTRLEITQAYAESVAKHGRASGVREGGNEKLEKFVDETLSAPNSPELNKLLEQYKQKSAELTDVNANQAPSGEQIEGKKLEKKTQQQSPQQKPVEAPSLIEQHMLLIVIAVVALLVIGVGFVSRGRKAQGGK